MVELLEFIFRSGWTFFGCILILMLIVAAIANFRPIKITHKTVIYKDKDRVPTINEKKHGNGPREN
jgi:hypothetical protein